jgi:transcription elongation GreA/GreB family factor
MRGKKAKDVKYQIVGPLRLDPQEETIGSAGPTGVIATETSHGNA